MRLSSGGHGQLFLVPRSPTISVSPIRLDKINIHVYPFVMQVICLINIEYLAKLPN